MPVFYDLGKSNGFFCNYPSRQLYAGEFPYEYLRNSRPHRGQSAFLPFHHDLNREIEKCLHILPESTMQFFENYPRWQHIAEQSLRKNPCTLYLHHDQGEFLPFHHGLHREMKVFRFFACIFYSILLKLPAPAAKCMGAIYAILPLGRFTSAPRSIISFTVLSWPEQRNERDYSF